MSKTEYAWVIQRADGMFWNCSGDSARNYETYFVDNIASAFLFTEGFIEVNPVEEFIKYHKLRYCQPVKVKIEIVGEDDE